MLIVANWKAYVESTTKAKTLLSSAKRLATRPGVEIVIAPPAPYLGFLVDAKSKVRFASQDLSGSTGGAKTGEITASLLNQLGVRYAIIGHSERRAQGETNDSVLEKVQHALAHGLTPIVCIGEHERDSEAQYLSFIRSQITSIMQPLAPKERLSVIFAYEPIWAIGKTALEAITTEDLAEMVLYIRKVLGEIISGQGAARVPILYGGSVESGNARVLAAGTGIEGFLVGHASTDGASFSALVKAVS